MNENQIFYVIIVGLIFLLLLSLALWVISRKKVNAYKSKIGELTKLDKKIDALKKQLVQEYEKAKALEHKKDTIVLDIRKVKNLFAQEESAVKNKQDELLKLNDELKPLFKLQSNEEKMKESVVELEQAIASLQKKNDMVKKEAESLKSLQETIDLYSNLADFVDVGHFEMPDYLYETSERYAEEIKRNRDKQKELIKNGAAVVWDIEATDAVIGTNAEAERALKGQVKLMLAAFNINCDFLIGKVRPGYFPRTLERIESLAGGLEKDSVHYQCYFDDGYIQLKLEECTLQYEYALKKKEEDEEQKLIREQMREEERARREYEKAIADAEREEQMYENMLNRAKDELSKANDEQMLLINAQIAELEAQLAEAKDKEQRAKSMAEQTRKGHVYIISNIGSFGEDVYKIGLTRRLEPLDRVRELGDASVPFLFDVHALIYSDDAPALEASLHRHFNDRRVNAVNYRKEFFYCDLEEIKNAVEEITGSEADFKMTAIAEEYYETQKINGIDRR